MKGMELSKAYFENYGRPMIEKQLSQYAPYIAAGLVGEGSECLGFDDELSQDHDFGPAFCLFVPQKIYNEAGALMQSLYDQLPQSFMGYQRINTPQAAGRIGVVPIEAFYMKYTGLEHAPQDNMQWFRIPESFLSTATSGEVFMDNLGEFTQIRNSLKAFYPEDVLKKKLAARCAKMAQAGQYNYPRSMKRNDCQAAYFACSEFVKTAMSAVYLLNGEYMPYYKWIFRGAEGFVHLKESVAKLKQLTQTPDTAQYAEYKTDLIENICIEIGRELNRRGYTKTTDPFLQLHGEDLMRSIKDYRLSQLHIMVD